MPVAQNLDEGVTPLTSPPDRLSASREGELVGNRVHFAPDFGPRTQADLIRWHAHQGLAQRPGDPMRFLVEQSKPLCPLAQVL